MKTANVSLPLLGTFLVFFAAVHAETRAANASSDLGGTSWQLVKFQGGDGVTLAPPDKAKYTIEFAKDGEASIRIDCNRGRATWKSTGPGQLQFGPLALTRAMCPPTLLNERIPNDLPSIRSYSLKEGHLFLSLAEDEGTYEMEPAGENRAVAKTPAISGLPATFAGTWPCADCPGILYQVNLLSDHTFVSRMTYEERSTRLDDHGSWELASDGKTLVLHGQHGAPEKFALQDADTLRKLDVNGHEIQSRLNLNYDLKRAKEFMPIELRDKGVGNTSLENTHWTLIQLGDKPVTASSKQSEPYFVLNSETDRVSGSGGCNRLTGSYKLKGDQLSFSQMAGTMMACVDGMDTEKDFLKSLNEVTKWRIAGQQLDLSDARGKLVAQFEARHEK
jgi:heat shock protein HslJ